MTVGKMLDLWDGNRMLVENIIVEDLGITGGTKIRLEGQLDSINPRFNCYCDTDVATAQEVYRTFKMTPQKVIYNDPATIVFWKDGTKTVVKCMEGDTYNPEAGLAMCVCKKLYGSKYHKFFRHYAPKEPVAEAAKKTEEEQMDEIYDKIHEMVKDVLKTDKSFLEKFASRLFGEEENIK